MPGIPYKQNHEFRCHDVDERAPVSWKEFQTEHSSPRPCRVLYAGYRVMTSRPNDMKFG